MEKKLRLTEKHAAGRHGFEPYPQASDVSDDIWEGAMQLMIVENTLSWCLFALAVACLATFAAALQEEFIRRRRRQRRAHRPAKIVPLAIADSKLKQTARETPMVRGYDSPELFREDLWLRRIAQSRRAMAALDGSIKRLDSGLGAREEYEKRVCAMLAHHPAARCDN